MYTEKALALLGECEKGLRSLMSEAAAAGDYEAVLRLTILAKELAAMMSPGSTPAKAVMESPATYVHKSTHKQKIKLAYPKFFRRGQELVKIGWSKREKKEYQHKAPYHALGALASSLSKIGVDGRIFSTEKFLPLSYKTDNNPFPDYQVYVCLALLKHVGLVDQHGRQGYSIPKIAEFTTAVEAAWQQLPEH